MVYCSGSQPMGHDTKVGCGRVAVGLRTAASMVCLSLPFLKLAYTNIVTLAKPKHGQVLVNFTLSPL